MPSENEPQTEDMRIARTGGLPPKERSSRWLWLTILQVGLGLGALALLAWIGCGSIASGMSYLRGSRLIPDAYQKSFGTVTQGRNPSVTFTVSNFANRPVTILGCTSSCSCIVVSELPVTILPSERAPFAIRVLTARKKGAINGSVQLFTDWPVACDFSLKVSGLVIGMPARADTQATQTTGAQHAP